MKEKIDFKERIKQLKSRDPEKRTSAVWSLVDFGKKAINPLVSMLEDRDSHVRAGAAHSLGVLKAGVAVEPLMERVRKDKNELVRWQAREALKKLNAPA
jgi:HEAT repeat protein